ncbi:MAG: hypothetical protein Q9178_005531 [Gyalolechia marmorata]
MLVRQDIQNLVLVAVTILFQTVYALPTDLSRPREVAALGKLERKAQSGGIAVDASACPGQLLELMRLAILDASYLAQAGIHAAANFDEIPFAYFFDNDIGTANTVAAVLGRVVEVQQRRGLQILATCEDKLNRCTPRNGGYTAQHPNNFTLLVVCPHGLRLPRNPKPCDARPGAISLGWLMLHQLVTVKSIAGPAFPIRDASAYTARTMRNLLLRGEDTTKLADAYAHLGSYSYDLGLNPQPWGVEPCRRHFYQGQFDLRDEILFDFKDYNLEIDFVPSTPEDSKLNPQLVIWTLLYLAFSMAARGQYTAVSAGVLWRGESVATVRINNSAGPSLSIGALNDDFLGSTLTSSNNATLQAGKERLEIEVWHDPEQPIAKDDLLLTALRAMGDALEAGVQNFASQQKTMGIHRVTWLLLSENDADGNPLFKFRYSVFAIHRIVELMIKDSLWSASLIVVRNLGIQVAKGGLNYFPDGARATNQQ